jgi:hypothetical protein
VRGLQAPELQYDQEPAQEFGAAGVQQVLPLLPEAHGAQGNQIAIGYLCVVICYLEIGYWLLAIELGRSFEARQPYANAQ